MLGIFSHDYLPCVFFGKMLLQITCVFYWFICVLIIKLWKFFIYSRSKAFIRYVIGNVLSYSVVCLFISNGVFQRTGVFNFEEVQFTDFFASRVLMSLLRNLCQTQAQSLSPVFSFLFSLGFVWLWILHLGVWPILGYISYTTRGKNQSSFFAHGYPIVSTLSVETTIFSPPLPSCQKSVIHTYIWWESPILGFSILFHSSLDLYISTALSWLLWLFANLEIRSS